ALRLEHLLKRHISSSVRPFHWNRPLSWPSWVTDRAVGRIESTEGASLIHAWGLSSLAAASRLGRAPKIASLRGAPSSKNDMRLLRVLPDDSTTILAGSQATRRLLAGRGIDPNRVIVIRNPVDFRAINEARKLTLRDRLAPPNEGPVIL